MVAVLGITGSIGMGKSTVTRMLKQQRYYVLDSDQIVHRLLRENAEVIAQIAALDTGMVKNNGVDKQALSNAVFSSPERLLQLEAILHPLVKQEQHRITPQLRRQRRRALILEIPLLFETGAQTCCNHTILVTAPQFLQMQRVLSRPGMTKEKYQAIMRRQWADVRKKRLADHLILTGLGKAFTRRLLMKILHKIFFHKRATPYA